MLVTLVLLVTVECDGVTVETGVLTTLTTVLLVIVRATTADGTGLTGAFPKEVVHCCKVEKDPAFAKRAWKRRRAMS